MRYLVLGVLLFAGTCIGLTALKPFRYQLCRAVGHGPIHCATVWLVSNR